MPFFALRSWKRYSIIQSVGWTAIDKIKGKNMFFGIWVESIGVFSPSCFKPASISSHIHSFHHEISEAIYLSIHRVIYPHIFLPDCWFWVSCHWIWLLSHSDKDYNLNLLWPYYTPFLFFIYDIYKHASWNLLVWFSYFSKLFLASFQILNIKLRLLNLFFFIYFFQMIPSIVYYMVAIHFQTMH